MYCPNCNQENPDNQVICQRCGATIRAATPSVELEKPEKVLNGILGALIGALIGGACIVLLNQAGYVAAISGIVLAFCTLKGYELLGGKLSKVGIAVSAVLILAMPFGAYLVSSGISFANEVKQYGMDLTWIESIQLLFELMEYEPEMIDALRSDLLQLYLYTGLGVVVFLASKAKSFKK